MKILAKHIDLKSATVAAGHVTYHLDNCLPAYIEVRELWGQPSFVICAYAGHELPFNTELSAEARQAMVGHMRTAIDKARRELRNSR